MEKMSLPTARWQSLTAMFFLPIAIALTGCGGSSNPSAATSTPVADTPAVLTETNSGSPVNPVYTISILPSGSASYTKLAFSGNVETGGTQTGTGTVPAALTAKFFQDLTAAMPLQNLPAFNGGGSVLSSNLTVQYQGQTGPIDNLSDAREQALAADATAIAQALGVPQS